MGGGGAALGAAVGVGGAVKVAALNLAASGAVGTPKPLGRDVTAGFEAGFDVSTPALTADSSAPFLSSGFETSAAFLAACAALNSAPVAALLSNLVPPTVVPTNSRFPVTEDIFVSSGFGAGRVGCVVAAGAGVEAGGFGAGVEVGGVGAGVEAGGVGADVEAGVGFGEGVGALPGTVISFSP